MLDNIIFGIARFVRGAAYTASNIVEANTNIISTILSTTTDNEDIVNNPIEKLNGDWVVVSLGEASSSVTKS